MGNTGYKKRTGKLRRPWRRRLPMAPALGADKPPVALITTH